MEEGVNKREGKRKVLRRGEWGIRAGVDERGKVGQWKKIIRKAEGKGDRHC